MGLKSGGSSQGIRWSWAEAQKLVDGLVAVVISQVAMAVLILRVAEAAVTQLEAEVGWVWSLAGIGEEGFLTHLLGFSQHGSSLLFSTHCPQPIIICPPENH